jgi:hypothetical protein|tara:strand:- start:532 stop:1173 length:642 start_codon:yes stop_codon:yes gene_type:complete
MGFQTGTQVDPRLLDYSGYAQGMTQAAAITGAMLANIGKEIGEKREEQKQKKATIGLMKDMIKSVPEFQQLTGMDAVVNPSDADLNTAATKLYDTLGDDMSQKVTLLALTSLFEDDDDDDVDPSTVMKFQELAETDPMIKLGKTGQLMRQTADKGSIFNPFDLISAVTSGKELNIFGDDPFMDVPISDTLIKNIKGGKEFQESRMYNPVGVLD